MDSWRLERSGVGWRGAVLICLWNVSCVSKFAFVGIQLNELEAGHHTMRVEQIGVGLAHRTWGGSVVGRSIARMGQIDQPHKPHNTPIPYPTMHHIGTETCTFLFQCGILWDMKQVHFRICETGLILFEFWHTSWVCQISKWYDNLIYQSFGSKRSWDFKIRYLVRYCKDPQVKKRFTKTILKVALWHH